MQRIQCPSGPCLSIKPVKCGEPARSQAHRIFKREDKYIDYFSFVIVRVLPIFQKLYLIKKNPVKTRFFQRRQPDLNWWWGCCRPVPYHLAMSPYLIICDFCHLMTPTRFELVLPPWKGDVLTAWPWGQIWTSLFSSLLSVTNSPSRTRTYDPTVNSRLLYRLSYRGLHRIYSHIPSKSHIESDFHPFSSSLTCLVKPSTD